jgi:hypothetical protein
MSHGRKDKLREASREARKAREWDELRKLEAMKRGKA